MARGFAMPDLKMSRRGAHETAIVGEGTLNLSSAADSEIEVAQNEALVAAYSDAPEEHAEHLDVCERVVISPCAGWFEPTTAVVAVGARIEVGAMIGRVSRREVRSPFAGRFMAMLALPGERIRPGQPVAWLRAD